MTDWSPLGRNPVPGDPHAIRTAGAGVCTRIAEEADDGRRTLARLALGVADDIWSDENSPVFLEKLPKDLIDDLKHLYDGYSAVATALRKFAEELEDAQLLAEKANGIVRGGQTAETRARGERSGIEESLRHNEGRQSALHGSIAAADKTIGALSTQKLRLQAQLRLTTDPALASSLQSQLNTVSTQHAQQLSHRNNLRSELSGVEAIIGDLRHQWNQATNRIDAAVREQERGRAIASSAEADRDAAGKRAVAAIDAADKSAVGSWSDHAKYRVRTSDEFGYVIAFVDEFQARLADVISFLEVLMVIPGLNVAVAPILGWLKAAALVTAAASLAVHTVNFAAGGETPGAYARNLLNNGDKLLSGRGSRVKNGQVITRPKPTRAQIQSQKPLQRAMYTQTHGGEMFSRRLLSSGQPGRPKDLTSVVDIGRSLGRGNTVRRIQNSARGGEVGLVFGTYEQMRRAEGAQNFLTQSNDIVPGRYQPPEGDRQIVKDADTASDVFGIIGEFAEMGLKK